MRPKKNPGHFDCLDFKEEVLAKICEQTKGMPPDQLTEFFQKKVASGPFASLWKRVPT